MSSRRIHSWVHLLGVLLLASLASCGYTSGVRLPAGAQTLGVTVFDNFGPQPEVERDLFACLSSQANRMVDAELVAPQKADLVIRGEIVEYRRLHGILNKEGQLQQSGVRLILRAWIEDQRLGVRIGDTMQVDQAVRYVIHAGEEEFGARQTALQHLCQELILDLFTQSDYESSEASESDVNIVEEVLEPLATDPADPLADTDQDE